MGLPFPKTSTEGEELVAIAPSDMQADAVLIRDAIASLGGSTLQEVQAASDSPPLSTALDNFRSRCPEQ